MNLKRVTIQLENGLRIKLRLLTSKESDKAYAKYITSSDPHIFKKDLYKAVFEFETRRLYAFCYADAVSLIISQLSDYAGTRALDYFECFVFDNNVIRTYDADGKRSQALSLLKLSVKCNLAPGIAVLLTGQKAGT